MTSLSLGAAGVTPFATFDRRGVRVGSGPLGSGQGGMGRCRP
ncbi:hypothetical protein [Streptomyces sp. JJ38]|nr:hypothetical protein [Streptomyces sp. JJ38]MBW1598869.1 sulfate adenylyltransferase [Streptomyces sp. JJ38]